MKKEDRDLKIALRNYVEAIFLFLNENAPNTYSLRNLLNLLIPDTVHPDRERQVPIYQLAEAQQYQKTIEEHPIVSQYLNSMVYTGFNGTRIGKLNVLKKFLETLIIRQRGLIIDSDKFDNVFELMMTYFKSPEVKVQLYSFLGNFHFWNEDTHELTNNWQLVRIGKSLDDDWMGIKVNNELWPHLRSWRGSALKKEIDMKKIILNPDTKEHAISEVRELPKIYRELVDEVDTIVTSFRLIKEGFLFHDNLDIQLVGWYPFLDPVESEKPNTSTPGTGYSFSIDDFSKLLEILKLMTTMNMDRKFRVALRRLNFAVERDRLKPEDIILDGMIAFESLFGEEKAVSYRISLRTAMLLGNTIEDRKRIKKDLMTAYNLRSSIIHGDQEKRINRILEKWGLTIEQAGERITQLLRESLVKYLELLKTNKTRKEVIVNLDERILSDSSI